MRVLALNLQLLPPLVTTTGGPAWKDARLKYFADRVLPEYDVVCLSEIWTVYAGPLSLSAIGGGSGG